MSVRIYTGPHAARRRGSSRGGVLPWVFTAATIGCQIIGQILMFQTGTLWLFAIGAGFFGYGMGGVVPLQGALVGRMFGRERFGKALGSMRPAMFPLQIAGVPLAALERLPHHFLAEAFAVSPGVVEEGHAFVDGRVHDADRLGFVAPADAADMGSAEAEDRQHHALGGLHQPQPLQSPPRTESLWTASCSQR